MVFCIKNISIIYNKNLEILELIQSHALNAVFIQYAVQFKRTY